MRAMLGGKTLALGRYVLGFGVLALGAVNLAWGDFDAAAPVPANFPGRTALVYIAAVFLIAVGAALMWRRLAAWAGAAIAIYFGVIIVVLLDGPTIVAHLTAFDSYNGTAEQLAIAMGGLIVFAMNAKIDDVRAARIVRVCQIVFGVCALVFGAAHFVYMNLTAPLVPKWLPPDQVFWGYATGIFHIAAGVALITGIQARVASILLTIMYAAFTPLVHVPILLAGHTTHFNWSENAENIALTGVAWVIADSLARFPSGSLSSLRGFWMRSRTR
jgi:uncharacterized membrane protein